MSNTQVKQLRETNQGWEFLVDLDGLHFTVALEKNYWQRLTKGKEDPEDLVRRSFEFLIEREAKESILKQFDLKVIGGYFTEYEKTISFR